MPRNWFRRLSGRGEPQSPGVLAVVRAVALGDDTREVERVAAAWARHQRELAEERQERELYEQSARELKECVMRGPGWFPGDGW
jgi:hypothetical protein